MKRLHVHIAVDDVARPIDFYSTLFSARPTVLKADYAKWMLEDPRVNLAISQRGAATGVEHLGIQVETGDELAEVYGRLRQADAFVLEEGQQPVATPNPKRAGSSTRQACHGNSSMQPATARSMMMGRSVRTGASPQRRPGWR